MKKAKVIMIQGTMSNVGKSVIVGALCRIFAQDGYSVCPFKSQNMALNSFITDDGLEMGRAQVMQAEAAGIKPDVRMNPILLKPTNDKGSQVIVNGKVLGVMSAKEYYLNKTKFIPEILSAFNYISEKYDIIVIEGAGSPAEINLKDNDIVNMGMAKLAKAPVILVGDIDRGGVFAQLIGTVNLLEADEKNYIKAMLINKFRGDKSILKSGLDLIEGKCQKPIIGVIPYSYFDIDDEDSLSERFYKRKAVKPVDIVVIKLPRMSNFTDFNVFECFDEVSLRYVSYSNDIGNPDFIIIPGTKNTIDDLLWLRENGIEACIKKHAAKGKPVFGICGGYQMLGEVIDDPDGIEHKGKFNGIGLLPIKTVFKSEKTRTRINGIIENVSGIFKNLKGENIIGYEIHMGEIYFTENCIKNMNVLYDFVTNSEKQDGININNIYGSFVHGIFDNDNIAKIIVEAIMKDKGIDNECIKKFDVEKYKESQYNLLADSVRNNIDMNMIYKILDDGMEIIK